MTQNSRKLRTRKCKCLHCKDLFRADYRNRTRQKYCSKPDCRRASKIASQRKWVTSIKGNDYFKGPDNVLRVQEWRKANPGYWRRTSPDSEKALQDSLPSQRDLNQSDRDSSGRSALQDICSLQVPLLLGLISHLTGTTLQDNIEESARRMVDLGEDILKMYQPYKPEGGFSYGREKSSVP